MRSSLLRLVCLLCLTPAACRRPAPPAPATPVFPQPQVSGSRPVDGLSAPVRIVRDRWGVPHIYAGNDHDLFFAQGFVQAQDRLFQMDLWRRSVQGRLAEVLGLNFIERDAATRRVQYRGDLGAEWASYGPGIRAIAEAFVAGVNAWVDEARAHVPEEFVLAGWLPETWIAEDLLNRTDAFVAAGADTDVFRARLVAALGAGRANVWYPAASSYRPLAELDLGGIGAAVGESLRRAGTRPFFLGLAAPVTAPGPAAGSNAWVVGGRRSATGAPLLANDPHGPFAHPSLRYLVHLNAPGWNVIGAASPWLPGVVIGHNERVAWGVTAVPADAADVADVYVERVNPANPHQVQFRGRWVDTTVVADPIATKGQAKPFPFEREYTPNGVIVATDSQRHLAFALKWAGFGTGAAGELAALALDRASSVAELREALVRWRLPVVEVVYASVDGAVGSQMAGLLPARSGWDGALPAPGWTGAYTWRGWQRFGMPQTASAERDVLLSVNRNDARLHRLSELLSDGRIFERETFQHMQRDTTAWNAGALVPLLAPLAADRSDVEAARQRLMRWDRRVDADSGAAALYVFWEEALARRLAELHLGGSLLNDYVARAGFTVTPLTEPSRAWFDGDPARARDRVLLEALATAVDRARESSPRGQLPASWGSLHALVFRHPLAISPLARRRFNVGPFPMAGYGNTLFSTFPSGDVAGGPSFREVVDLADWDRSRWTNAPGQSGSAGSRHFADLAGPWAGGEYFQMAFSAGAVQAVTESELTLVPR